MGIETARRPRLTRAMSLEAFRESYWLKVELQDFCRQHGLSTMGGKQEIAARIEVFLQTGDKLVPAASPASSPEARRFNAAAATSFTMQTRCPAGFKCTQEVRRFFVAHLGEKFRFTVTLQQHIRDNPGITFQAIADEWLRQEQRRKKGWKPEIASQFELNRFTRDFFADPRNKGKSRQDCLDEWKRARARPGAHGYVPPAEQ